jgi:hypothetical protein
MADYALFADYLFNKSTLVKTQQQQQQQQQQQAQVQALRAQDFSLLNNDNVSQIFNKCIEGNSNVRVHSELFCNFLSDELPKLMSAFDVLCTQQNVKSPDIVRTSE